MVSVFKNINLIDGTGEKILKNAYMKVENGIIGEIGVGWNDNNKDFEVTDLGGKYVMPGMIDCHTHITFPGSANPELLLFTANHTDITILALKNLERLLKHGVTYIRDLGDYEHISIKIKKYLADGSIKGPNICSAGKAIMMTGGHGHQAGREADGVVEVMKATREQIKAGADVIKVISSGGVMTKGADVNAYQFNVDELSAAVVEAHKTNRKVATHCHSTQGIKNSILAGIDSIEHSTILDEEAVSMMVEAGTYIVPTLIAVKSIIDNGESAGIPKFMVEKAKLVSKNHYNSIKMAYDAGIKIAMGTDCGTPFNIHGISAPLELELMVEAGMTPMDVIKSATKTSSELLGIEEQYGTLEVGKFADFLVLDENPIENIKTIQSLSNVYQKGQLMY
jgi:imidazolonepropionase-like amidohydrolase